MFGAALEQAQTECKATPINVKSTRSQQAFVSCRIKKPLYTVITGSIFSPIAENTNGMDIALMSLLVGLSS
jgi:hypothetical protein